jgi:hypothetical protein
MQAIICREMKWTYEEFLAQPVGFVQLIIGLIFAENRAANRRNG